MAEVQLCTDTIPQPEVHSQKAVQDSRSYPTIAIWVSVHSISLLHMLKTK